MYTSMIGVKIVAVQALHSLLRMDSLKIGITSFNFQTQN